jgi:WD40 repeat protein
MFVQYFGMAMAKSAPHIYLSALPFAPTCSVVSSHYSSSFPQILHVEHGQLSHWPSLEMMISNVGSPVYCIAVSPDSQHIVSGSEDKTICVWNATTGEMVAGPFTGHTDSVWSVAFSPDGQHIVSGSRDKTICVWNATTGEMWQAHLLVTHIQSALWHSHQMASTLSQALMTKQFVCGMLLQER